MNWLNSTNKKIQSFHWNPPAGVYDLTFMDENGSVEYTNCIDFLELNASRRKTYKIKIHMLTMTDDSESRVSVYNVWFADSVSDLEYSVANDAPTEIICNSWPYPLPVIYTFDVTTRYMAINYDPSKSNHVSSLTSIAIYAY